MMKYALAALGLALPLALAGVASAQSADRAALVSEAAAAETSAPARIAALLQAGNGASETLLALVGESARPGERREVRRRIARLRANADETNVLAARLRQDFGSIEADAFAAHDEETAALLAESFVYLDGLERAAALSLELASALESESRAQILTARQRLALGVAVMLEGRIALMHAHQQLSPASAAAHHRFAALAALYQAMRTLAHPSMLDRPAALEAAARSLAASVAAGRAALSNERAAPGAGAERGETLAAEAAALEIAARAAAIVEAAAADARAGVPAADLYMRHMGGLGALERQWLELGRTSATPLSELVPVEEV